MAQIQSLALELPYAGVWPEKKNKVAIITEEYDVILDRIDDTVVFGNESLREHIKELKRETEQDVEKVLVKIDNAIKKATD